LIKSKKLKMLIDVFYRTLGGLSGEDGESFFDAKKGYSGKEIDRLEDPTSCPHLAVWRSKFLPN